MAIPLRQDEVKMKHFLVATLLTLAALPAAADQVADLISGKIKECRGCDLTGANFKKADLSGVDLTGAKRLTLRVDFADRGDELDHADWLNARLVK